MSLAIKDALGAIKYFFTGSGTGTELDPFHPALPSNAATATLQQATIDALDTLTPSLTFADGPALDAFGKLRISEGVSEFQAQCQYDAEPLQYEIGNTGSGVLPVHNSNTRMVALSCGAGSGVSFIQSYLFIPYQAGKSQRIAVTGVLGAGVANQIVEIGYFDWIGGNGIFYRQDGTNGVGFGILSKTNGTVVEDFVTQSEWNADKLDGTGASGVTLAEALCFILVIDLQFLSMGRVRIGFDIGGRVIYAHEFNHANILAVPYMQTATLPICMQVRAVGSAASKTAYFKCANVDSEGGVAQENGYSFSTPNLSVTAGSNTRTHLATIRPKLTFNGITNRTRIAVIELSFLVTGTNNVFWELIVGAEFSVQPTFSDMNTTYSTAEYGTGGTYTGGTGIVLESDYVLASNQVKGVSNMQITAKLPISLNRDGAHRALGSISVFVTGLGGTSATNCSIKILEVR